jgi:outer membrane protein OmpA-like peptidoglycan-associated protein
MKLTTTSKIVLSGAFVVLAACASKVTKYNYPADSDSTKVIGDLQSELQTDHRSQADVFAKDSFEQAQKHLDKAKKLQESGAKNEKVLDEAGLAKAYSEKAQEQTERSKADLSGVADARQLALEGGAANVRSKQLKDVDDDFASYVEKSNKGKATPEKTAEFQKRYSDIELDAITETQLSQSEKWINNAKDMGAEKRAPQSFANAKEDYNNARLVISTDRHDDAAIDAAVAKSNASAQRLVEVTREAKTSDIPENVAVDVVTKRHAIDRLNRRVGESREENAALMDDNTTLANKMATDARISQAIAEAQQSFDKKDAEVYSQGNNILLRLKTVQFASGKSDIPTAAFAVLGKTKQVIQDLRAKKVVIQGHTDSTGSAALNKKLSLARAEAVADYLSSDGSVDRSMIEAVGYGDMRPLTTNKTVAGRAQNRRVDVVITPGLNESNLSKR